MKKNLSTVLFFNDETKRRYLFGVCQVVIKLRMGKSVDKLLVSHETNALRDPLEILSVNLVHDWKQLHTFALSEEQVGHRKKENGSVLCVVKNPCPLRNTQFQRRYVFICGRI